MRSYFQLWRLAFDADTLTSAAARVALLFAHAAVVVVGVLFVAWASSCTSATAPDRPTPLPRAIAPGHCNDCATLLAHRGTLAP